MFARAENSEATIHARDCGAARAWFALVTRHRRVAEIHAPSSLEQIAGGSRHVAKLCRRTAQERFGEDGVVLANNRMISKVGIANYCADAQATVGQRFDLVEG